MQCYYYWLSGLVYPDPLVLAEGRIIFATHQGGAPCGEKELEGKYHSLIIDRFINWFHIVFKRVNCTHKIWKFRFVALCEGDVGGMGMTLYDLRQQLDVFPPTLGFSTTSLVLVL